MFFRINHERFEVEAEPSETILQVLKRYPQIKFRANCEYGKCGSCAALVDSKPVLLCKEVIGEREEIRLEPLSSFPVLKDLVCDIDFDLLKQSERPVPGADFKEMQHLRRCKECFLCLEVCPVFKAIKSQIPPILNKNLVRKAITQAISNNLFLCTSCGRCAEVCPAEIDVFEKVVQRLRSLAPTPHSKILSAIDLSGKAVRSSVKFNSIYPAHPETNRILLFIGCLGFGKERIARIYHRFIEFLNSKGFSVFIPPEQICCGSPVWKIGADERFDRLSSWNGQLITVSSKLHSINLITSLCPGCLSMLGKRYPFKNPKVVQPFELLESKIELNGAAVHLPCHLKDRQDIPITGNFELIDLCCGAGGGVRSYSKSDSLKIGEELRRRLEGFEQIITVCNFCTLQIEDLLQRPILHLWEVV